MKLWDKAKKGIENFILGVLIKTPQFQELNTIYEAILKSNKVIENTNITCQHLILVSPTLHTCSIEVSPTVENKVVLSNIAYESLLTIGGSHARIEGSYFNAIQEETALLKSKKNKTQLRGVEKGDYEV